LDAVNGAKKELHYEKKGKCLTCNGSRCKPGTAASKCGTCAGKGTINYRQGPMTVQMTCSKCKGQGNVIKNPCMTCKGTGIGVVKQKEEIVIPKGINNGQNLRMSSKGNQGENGGPPGDLVIRVSVQPDPYFKREGYDIYTDAYLTISQAVLGAKLDVKTLNGTQIINVDRGTQHGERKKFAGQGVPKLNSNERGDHFVVFKVVVPKTLTPKQMDVFRQLSTVEEKPDTAQYANRTSYEDHGTKSQQQQQQQSEEEKGGGRRRRGTQEDEEPDLSSIFEQMFAGNFKGK